MFRPMTRGCPYASGCSTPSPGSDRTNKLESHEKGPPPETESYVCSMEEIRTEVVSDKFTDEDHSDSFSELQGSILWPRRSYMYRIAFLSMLPAFGLFLFGFSCPFWMKKYQVAKHRGHYNQIDHVDVSIGLWRVCQGLDFAELTDCTTLPDISSYTMACQAMLCLCLIFTFFSLVFGMYENCATRYDIDDRADVRTRRPEVNAIAAGIFGMIGVSLYGVIIIGVAKDGKGGVHWAFPLTACAVTGVTICGILMAISNPIRNTSMGYAGQVIGLSHQNSTQGREMSMQDRLVSSNGMGSSSPVSGSNTTYGVNTEMTPNSTEMTYMKRTDSFLSSHMSSPDLFTTTNSEDSPSHQQTHVVETYDLYTRPNDPVKKQILKKQLESKAAQRRSWHFDDKHGAYVVSDLINNPSGSGLPVETKRKEGGKPPVPPRRDKMLPPSVGQNQLQAISGHADDLMMLEDPVVTVPSSKNSSDKKNHVDPNSVPKRNTNPFLDDVIIEPGTANGGVGAELDGSNEWQNQPWPEPPTESEILGEHFENKKPERQAGHSRSGSKSNDVPESLQYQPQNFGSLVRKKSTESRQENRRDSSGIDPGGKPATQRRPGSRKSSRNTEQNQRKPDPPVSIMKEYDNPLFKPSPRQEGREKSACQPPAYDSTSFITPAPRPPPPSYYAATTNDSFHQNPSLNSYGTVTDSESNIRRATGHYDSSSQNQPRNPSLQHNKKTNGQHKFSPKTKPKPAEKSRPRQIKREHIQRRAGSTDSPVSQNTSPGYYSSNPDISRQSPRASPRTPRRRPESMGREEIRAANNRNMYQTETQQTNSARQSPYYPSHSPWDSDL